MRKYLFGIIAVLLMASLFGCSKDTTKGYEKSTVVIDEKGKIVEYIIEDFTMDNYSEDELKSKIEAEITNYNNESAQDSISLKEFVVIDGKAKVTLGYVSYIDFEKFNQVTFFVGTVEEAIAGEYDLDVILQPQDDSQASIEKSEIADLTDKHIIICDMGINIVVPNKVSFFSEDVVLVNSKEVETLVGIINYIIY